MADLQPQRIQANGQEFAYLEAGKGPLVVCLHGFPDTAWGFTPVLHRLAAAGFRAVAPFMRGYAPSAIPADGDYRVVTLAADLIALVEQLGGGRAFVVGHDWGSAAACTAAALRPDLLPRLVLAGVPHPGRFISPSWRQLRRSRYIGLFQLRGIAERRIRSPGWLERLLREWSPGWQWTDAQIAPVRTGLDDPARLRAMLGYYRALPGELLKPRNWVLMRRPITVPALVIRGEQDGCVGTEMFDGMERLFPAGVDVVTLSAAGHFMHIERSAAFADLVIEFLRPAPY